MEDRFPYNKNMANKTYLTRAGYEKLRKDMENLQEQKHEVSLMIGEAREQGDLKENAGYQYAREKQAEILRRLGEIEERLSNVHLIEETKISKDEVRIGAKVTVLNVSLKEEFIYQFVGQEESDPSNGKLSVHSPLGHGLLGHKVGDEVTVQLPAGPRQFKIIKIDR